MGRISSIFTEPGGRARGMHLIWQNGLPIVLIFLILSLVLSFVIITKHVIIMISSWRSWHKCFLYHSQTNPLLRRLKRVRESRNPSPSTRNFFVFFTLLTANLLPFCFQQLLLSDHPLLLRRVTSAFFLLCVVWCSVMYLPSFFLGRLKVCFFHCFFSISPFFSFVPSFEAAEVACQWSMNRSLHYRTWRQKRVAHHAHGCGLHGQPGYFRHNNRRPKTEKSGTEKKKARKKSGTGKKSKTRNRDQFCVRKNLCKNMSNLL